MKVLVFSKGTETEKYYEMIYEGLATCGTKGAETRTIGKVFAKLEREGVQKEKSLLYVMKSDSADIELEDAQYDLMKRLLDGVEWSGLGARTAGPMLEWLDSAPTKEQFEAHRNGVLKVEK